MDDVRFMVDDRDIEVRLLEWLRRYLMDHADDVRRAVPDLLVAWWYVATYGARRWRKRWGAWADGVGQALWYRRYRGVALPPRATDRETA